MILGAEFNSQIVQNGVKHFPNGPTAQKISFGWIVFGQTNIPSCHFAISAATKAADDDELMQSLARFWSFEDAPQHHV